MQKLSGFSWGLAWTVMVEHGILDFLTPTHQQSMRVRLSRRGKASMPFDSQRAYV